VHVADIAIRNLRRRPLAVAGVGLVAAVFGWWVWPTWSGADDQLDVLVTGDAFVAGPDATRSLDLRVREDGRTIDHVTFADWCAAADGITSVVTDRRPLTIVATFADDGGCGDGAARFAAAVGATGRELVIVQQPGTPSATTPAPSGVDVVDPSPLLGPELAATSLRCQWWEAECGDDGKIAVRDIDGSLTAAGAERLGRFVVAAL
jgi:hypothetical protein